MINYRYTIMEKLGEGASGEVFSVQDRFRQNQPLAMKILHAAPEGDQHSDETFRNEVSQLLNLTHPNLVRLFDFGIVRHAREAALVHRRFFTMEFVQGIDALTWMQHNSDQQQRDHILGILLMQVLSVLDYIHREGIIHFDVKPQNLVIVGGKESSSHPLVKLMDFGFSRKVKEDIKISIRGTLEYTAPELLSGEPFDCRVDLYSLGATFYHLMEGRCPFEASTPVDLVKSILNEPLRFSQTSDSGLQPIIAGLMHKNPAQRFQSAGEAAHALAAQIPAGSEVFESYFGLTRKPRFVGRRAEVKLINDALLALISPPLTEQPMAIAITGPEGIGKTSLLQEAVKSARQLELPVYELEPQPNDIPFQTITAMLPILSSDVRSYSAAGALLAERAETTLHLDPEGAARFDVPVQETEIYIELVARFMVECCNVFPFVIAADNLQHADEQSLLVLQTLLRDTPAGRVVLITAETGEQSRLLPSDRIYQLQLGELEQTDVQHMSSSVLGDPDLGRQVGETLFALYGGTPVIITEALTALLGTVPKRGTRSGVDAQDLLARLQSDFPRNVDEFLIERFKKLSSERQLVLNVLSCMQYPVRVSVLARILPFHRLRSADHLRFLQLEGFLGTSDRNRAVFIRLNRLKQSIYERIADERVELHTLIATTLERHHSGTDFTELQELAHQYSAAAMPLQASHYYQRAAELGVDLFALQRSVWLLRRAIEECERAGEENRRRLLQVRLVTVLYKVGMYQEAVELGTELEQHPDLEEVARRIALKHVGLSLSRLGEGERAKDYIEKVLRLSSDPVEQLELRQELVGLQVSSGHFQEAEQESLKQLEKARALTNTRLQGAIYTDLGIATFFQDKFDDAVRYFGEAQRLYELLNERSQVVNAINNIGNALSAKGDYQEAIRQWERALQASLDFGTLNQQSQIYSNLGIAHYNLKQYEKAKLFYEKAIDVSRRSGSHINLTFALNNLGEVYLVEGEYERALRVWYEASSFFADKHHVYALAETKLHIAEALERIGSISTMFAHLNETGRLLADNRLDTLRERYEYLLGLCAQRQGKHEYAEKYFKALDADDKPIKQKVFRLQAALHLAQCFIAQGKLDQAAERLLRLESSLSSEDFSFFAAEVDYYLGVMAKLRSELVDHKPIVYFKRGMDRIASEPVGEITWKLAYALGLEYYERGQLERAREFLVKARLVLKFFLSRFQSQELKRMYLESDNRDRVLSSIESILSQRRT